MSLFPEADNDGELPGEDIVRNGIADLGLGKETTSALLVSIGAPRLRKLGLELPPTFKDPEDRLFSMLERDGFEEAHSRYNALVRRLIEFESNAERLGFHA